MMSGTVTLSLTPEEASDLSVTLLLAASATLVRAGDIVDTTRHAAELAIYDRECAIRAKVDAAITKAEGR